MKRFINKFCVGLLKPINRLKTIHELIKQTPESKTARQRR